MTTTTAPPPAHAEEVPGVAAALDMLRSELGRADTKASLMLALTGGALLGAGAAAPQLHPSAAAAIVGSLGIVTLFASTVLMLLAVRPVLAGTGWPQWHMLSDADLTARLAAGTRADEVRTLQAAARKKFLRVRYGIDAALAGLGLLAVAAALTTL
ncbi:Pycsar system effector family protein [Streptomyces laurentii]|uniref:Pycsar system effector family protein n=1 Tax=Streptomyces laurentii TaxID=39478 RepID=UPI0036861BE5